DATDATDATSSTADLTEVLDAESVAVADEEAEVPTLEEDEGLKELDEALGMLDLSEEELSDIADMDKTVVVSADESEEVVDLDDVLEDPNQK
ncbi:MAG: hypothetical protein OQK92_08390, partial [Sedimenticola sp.]|nr:hypothetical protein [Sedimenticola sp.]